MCTFIMYCLRNLFKSHQQSDEVIKVKGNRYMVSCKLVQGNTERREIPALPTREAKTF